MLTDDQKRTLLNISRFLLFRYEDGPDDFIEQVVTQDETWAHYFDPELKMQSKQWKHLGSPPTKKLKRVLCLSLFCCALLCVLSSFAIILKMKKKLVALLLLSCGCVVTVNVLWLFLTMPWVGMQYEIVVFPDHTRFLF